MLKQPMGLDSNPSIYKVICIFNSISKCIGFAITQSEDTFFRKFLREIIFFWILLFAFYCTIRSELWCIAFLDLSLDVRKVVVFFVSQTVNLSPPICLLYFRFYDFAIWNIILKIRHLEENLIICNIYLEIGRIGSIGLFYWGFHFFIIMSMMYCSLWHLMMFFVFDSICMFYFDAWIAIPYLQFISWIWFLGFVSYYVQLKIIEINKLEYLVKTDFCKNINTFPKPLTWYGYEFDKMNQIKKMIVVLKQVLNIANELSAAYGITVLIYIVSYLSRVILQFYDLIDKDAQKFSIGINIVNIIVRIVFILPVFIFCERLSDNIHKAVELIQEVVTIRQPSCLDGIFQSLTLRLQHQSTTTQICGFLNITYGSFLTILTTALGFLLLQLQF